MMTSDNEGVVNGPVRCKPFALRDDELGPLRYGYAQGVQHHVPYDRGQKTTSRKIGRKVDRGWKGGKENGETLISESSFGAHLEALSGDGTKRVNILSISRVARFPRSGESHSGAIDPVSLVCSLRTLEALPQLCRHSGRSARSLPPY